jgi:hypothetical protein
MFGKGGSVCLTRHLLELALVRKKSRFNSELSLGKFRNYEVISFQRRDRFLIMQTPSSFSVSSATVGGLLLGFMELERA